jgi:hypothetical protein
MLGEQVSEFNGKITGQRVLDVEGPTMETSVAASGNLKGIQASESSGTCRCRPFSRKRTYISSVIHSRYLVVISSGWIQISLVI